MFSIICRILLMRKLSLFLFLATIYLLLPTHTYAATITACPSGPSATCIQQAVDQAQNGDTITIPSGNYVSKLPVVTNPKNCLVDTKAKNLTIQGVGTVVIDNGNGGVDDATGATQSMGICVMDGEVTIENLTIKQTLRSAIYLQNARAILKNVDFIDIDGLFFEMHQSQAMLLNSLVGGGGGGFSIGDTSYARIENNTFYGGGVTVDLCNNNEPSADISNNIFVRSNITAKCPEETQKMANIKTSNNFVYRGSPTGDQSCAGPGNTVGESCAAGEICTGSTFVWPDFIGADEHGTVCVWGEGFIQGDFHTQPSSPAGNAGAGYGKGPCTLGAATCDAYVASKPLPQPVEPAQQPPPAGNQVNNQQQGNPFGIPLPLSRLIDLPNNFALPNFNPSTLSTNTPNGPFNLFTYIAISFVYIMVMHLAINMGSEFSLGFMITLFVFGGVIGGWMHTYETGFVLAAILSLIFIGGPKKEM